MPKSKVNGKRERQNRLGKTFILDFAYLENEIEGDTEKIYDENLLLYNTKSTMSSHGWLRFSSVKGITSWNFLRIYTFLFL